MARKRLGVVTGSRAEYGLLRHLIGKINCSDDFELLLFVTGSHLDVSFGNTVSEIYSDGLKIDYKIDLGLTGDSSTSIAQAVAIGLTKFAQVFTEANPDLVLILGDRFELMAVALASLFAKVPLAHLHGGELTAGAIDDSIRHSLTKMSHIHFVANAEYRKRVIQLGEQPQNVFIVGGLGVDAIKRVQLIDQDTLEEILGIKFHSKKILVTFHPITLEDLPAERQIGELLSALSELPEVQVIFTMPNADSGGRVISEKIREFVRDSPNRHYFPSLGQQKYLSCLAIVDAVVGNSSSGLTEAPSFGTPTINIGSRQNGRLFASSVISCELNAREIKDAILAAYRPEFRMALSRTVNPYGEGGAVEKIISVLSRLSFSNLLQKKFYDVNIEI